MIQVIEAIGGIRAAVFAGVAAACIAALGLQHVSLLAKEAELYKARSHLAEARQQLAQAEADSLKRGAETGEAITKEVEEANEQDRPAVERVVERIRNVCVRPQNTDRLPVPESSTGADDAAARAEDAEREFALNLGLDLEVCSVEMNKLRGLQKWVTANGG